MPKVGSSTYFHSKATAAQEMRNGKKTAVRTK